MLKLRAERGAAAEAGHPRDAGVVQLGLDAGRNLVRAVAGSTWRSSAANSASSPAHTSGPFGCSTAAAATVYGRRQHPPAAALVTAARRARSGRRGWTSAPCRSPGSAAPGRGRRRAARATAAARRTGRRRGGRRTARRRRGPGRRSGPRAQREPRPEHGPGRGSRELMVVLDSTIVNIAVARPGSRSSASIRPVAEPGS